MRKFMPMSHSSCTQALLGKGHDVGSYDDMWLVRRERVHSQEHTQEDGWKGTREGARGGQKSEPPKPGTNTSHNYSPPK